MNGKLALTTIAAACALCFVLVGCAGGSASSTAASSAASTDAASSEASSSAVESSASSTASESAKHDGYFVGRWDLYETEDATHDQVAQVKELYATDKEYRAKLNEATGRNDDNPVKFCIQFNADGTGEMDTGAELVSFTWEASTEGAVTFTSFGGKEYALHVPVVDGKITLNSGDTFAKAG